MILSVCVFSFTQKVNHTYMKDGIKSYIDNVLITESYRENILNFITCSDYNDCISDHFPIQTKISINLNVRLLLVKPVKKLLYKHKDSPSKSGTIVMINTLQKLIYSRCQIMFILCFMPKRSLIGT